MKRAIGLLRKKYVLITALMVCIVSIPSLSNAQKNAAKKDINIVVHCVESNGNGKLVAHFGYENLNKKTVVIDENGSVVTYNYGQSKKLGLNTFEPGVVEIAFSEEFDVKERVEWTVTLPNGKVKVTNASINSNHCTDPWTSLNIIPGYYPPEGGKEYNSKIGAELTALYEAYRHDPNVPDAPEEIFQINGTKVLIEVVANPDMYNALISSLGEGFDIVTEDLELNRATGWWEIGDLLSLNAMDALHFARPVFPGVGNYDVPPTGLTKSQGDFAMHSDFARLGYEIDGKDVKIGVLSNSYNSQNGAGLNVSNGDLPGVGNINGYSTPVHVLQDITNRQLSDEGRAMLQIIHDIAPGAELAFRTGFLGEQDMADGIRQLAAKGDGEDKGNCHIIVDDLSYITEPFFADGVISQAINEVVGNGVTFFSSAGNFGKASFTDNFDPEPAPLTINGTAHDFDGQGDIFQGVELAEGNYTLVLQWDDGSDGSMNTTLTDLDIFLSDDVGFSLLGFNRENVGGFPIEVVPFSVVGGSVLANVVIAMASEPTGEDVTFKYILFRGGSQFKILGNNEGASTIVGHPNAAGAITVGAVRFDKNPIYNPAYKVPEIMSFSSIGGTPVYGGEPRNKPDFTAPNGVNTTINLGNGDWDSGLPPDNDPTIDPDTQWANFFGTSAASPHAAGMAALLIEAGLKFESTTPLTPEEIRILMSTTAIEMEHPGGDYNYVSGSGFIQAHKAIMEFANPTPYVENLILISEGGVAGEEITPASFTVTGDFFTDDTQIWFRGAPLSDGVTVENEGTITVEHPPFLGNPEVQTYNPPISEFQKDGGHSEISYFSDPIKRKVFIVAESKTKMYGETAPVYTGNVLVEIEGGDPVTLLQAVEDGIMLEEEAARLSDLSFYCEADANSVAGIYIIIPSLNPVLDVENPDGDIETAIANKYKFVTINGTLTIEKLALKITPNPVDMVYGDELPGDQFTFSYEIQDSDLNIEDLDLIRNGAKGEHLAALTSGVALVRGIALVNGIPMIRGIALVNGVKMIRGIALVNGVEVEVKEDGYVYLDGEKIANGTHLVRGIALVNDLPFVSMTEIVRGIALVNGSKVTFEDGYMIALDGVQVNKVAAVRGIALVNGINKVRGIALVNGVEVIIDENGVTTIGGQIAPTAGIIEMNGIPVVRGIALVNSSLISEGIAFINDVEVPIENGLPKVRGIALVNGIPLIRGIALVNDLKVIVDNGDIQEVWKDENQVNSLTFSRGIALVNDVALVNYTDTNSEFAIENGIAVINDEGPSEVLVNLQNMNFMASATALAIPNKIPSVRGIALVNGMESLDGEALMVAVDGIEEGDKIVFESSITSRGIALVNGGAYIRGIALVNELPVTSSEVPVVNGATAEVNGFDGTIMVFDATNIGAPAEDISFTPMSFITGTTAGKHWIVPGTFLSNNFEISYGLGTLTIDPAPLTISADPQNKTYGEDDPVLSYPEPELPGGEDITGTLSREPGEDVGEYEILQGSLYAGENHTILLNSAYLTILPAEVIVTPVVQHYCMKEGDPISEFSFDYFGLIPDDPIDVEYIILRESDGVPYEQSSDESAGIYTVTPVPVNDNYTFIIEPGMVYVNPYGPGTRAIKPVLNCIRRITGDTFIANFAYKNDNNVPVCIPKGVDNSLTGNGIWWAEGQALPTIFEPGGGEFYVYFDGTELSWVVNSLDEDHKASSAANANSNSTKCKNNTKAAVAATAIEEKEFELEKLLVYPNPVTDKLHITMKGIEHYNMIMMYDIAGSSHSITSIDKRTDNLEIDMAQLPPGYYFIKIVMEDSLRVLQVIKQ